MLIKSVVKSTLLKSRRIFTRDPLERLLRFLVLGADHQSFLTKFIPPPEYYKGCKPRVVIRDDIVFQLDRSCMAQWYVYWALKEPARSRLYSLVSEGATVFDVGANMGETLLHFSKYVKPTGYVYGFEPDPLNYENASKNIALNSFQNIELMKVGLSDQIETVKLYRVNEHNLGMNRVLSEAEAEGFEHFSFIETTTIDSVVKEKGITKLDLIKMDIEGFEMNALRGAEETLRSQRPKLFVEVINERLIQHNSSGAELIGFLHGLGYEVFSAATDLPVSEDFDFRSLVGSGIDVYAIPKMPAGTS